MKKSIVVTGSQDGILGVFTNKKKAFERAAEYVKGAYETELNITYAQFCKQMNNAWTVEVGEGYAVATCSTFVNNEW
jgi:hypothetical protein